MVAAREECQMIWGFFVLIALVGAALAFSRTWWLPHRKGLVAVMYHHVGITQPSDEQFPFTVTPKMMEDHLKLLHQYGFTTVGLEELQASAGVKKPAPRKPVLLTFDDGYEDAYTALFPLLQKRRAKAVIFLITDKIGTPGYLTWPQIEEMQKSGLVSFGSHGVSHRRLRSLSNEEIRAELADSKKCLEEKLGRPVTAFCYPYGAGGFDKRVRPLVFEAGYLFDFSTRKGINPWPWKKRKTILRVFPRGGETLFDFYLQITRGKNRL